MTTPPSRPWDGLAMKWAPSTSSPGRKWIQSSVWQGKDVGRVRDTYYDNKVLVTFGL